jgi:periplasmic protein TonB
MASIALYDQLDSAIDALMASPEMVSHADPALSELLDVAAELRALPRPEFKMDLRARLIATATTADVAVRAFPVIAGRTESAKLERELQVLPTLFGGTLDRRGSTYPVQRTSFVTSIALHVAVVGLVIGSGVWMANHSSLLEQPKQQITQLTLPLSDVLPVSPKQGLSGGGGGGDRDKIQAPKGALPKSAIEQLAPPAMVIRNEHPSVPVKPTVVMPPQMNMPNLPQLGDPASRIVGPASNGIGSGGGIGSGDGGGIGAGYGRGVGLGYGGGMGGGVFKVGGGVSAPKAIYAPDPEYSEEARKAKFQGTVIMWTIIGPDGRPRDLKVSRGLGMGLDQKAVEAVRRWRFEPAMKDGHPVAVQVQVEVNFHLY